MIRAQKICKSYRDGKVKALKEVSLEIADGEFVVILGASGSGKSTLLSVLSGLEHADSGIVEVDGENLSSMTERQLTSFRREKVGLIFQQYYLLSHLSVEKNVKLGADLAHNSDFRRMLESVGLADKLKSRPAELSGGEQQRVCIARALAKNPRILFADEPTGALDEATGRRVLEYLARLRNEKGFTLVMVTHNINVAEMADIIVHMNSGEVTRIVKNISPKSAYEIGW